MNYNTDPGKTISSLINVIAKKAVEYKYASVGINVSAVELSSTAVDLQTFAKRFVKKVEAP